MRSTEATDLQLRLLAESMVRDGHDAETVAAAVRGADDRPRVLVAEDETLVRLDIGQTLEAAGMVVCAEAADGPEAVTLALRHDPDVIVMDAGLPRVDGVRAAEEILATKHIPIVMLTGYRYGELIDRAFAVGVSRYLVKPAAESELVDAVRAAIASAG
ncbi:MAG TPA: response regulator [Gaiellaceae bacterium]|jgi:response regulator NasT